MTEDPVTRAQHDEIGDLVGILNALTATSFMFLRLGQGSREHGRAVLPALDLLHTVSGELAERLGSRLREAERWDKLKRAIGPVEGLER